MRLESVEIINYRVIKEAHLALPDQLIGIIGPNGSGKSSLVEAITWALYGHQVARSGKEEIKASFAAPSDTCSVELAFALNDERYRLVRRLVGKSERAEVELYRAGASESIGIAETRGYIETLLGLDWRGFLTSFLARQQELNALTDLPAAKRREHLAGMLGIERVDRAIGSAKETARQTQERLGILSQQMASGDGAMQRLALLREQAGQRAAAIEAATGAQRMAAQQMAAATNLLREQQDRKAACSRWEQELVSQGRSEMLLVETGTKLRAELDSLEAAGATLPTMQAEVATLAALRDNLTQLRQLQQSAALRAETNRQIESLRNDQATQSNQVNELSEQLRAIEQELASQPADLSEKAQQTRTELATLRDRTIQVSTRRDQHLAMIKKLTSQAATLTELDSEPICDRCLRPLSAHDLDQVRRHLADERQTTEVELASLEQELAGLVAQRRELEDSLAGLERMVARSAQLNATRASLDLQRQNFESTLAATTAQLATAMERRAQFGEMEFDPAELARCEAEVTRIEQVETTLNRLQGKLARLPEAAADLADNERKLAQHRTEMARVREEITRTGFEPAMLAEAERSWQAAQQKLETAQSELTKAVHARDLADQEIELTERQLALVTQLETEIEQNRSQQFRSETLARLLGDFKKHLIARIRPRLADLTGQLLADMTDGRYSLVELDEEYQIRLHDMGQFYGIDRFSGGETDLANLCLRLAISQALTESAGMERSFVMLDEVFGSQDEVRRDLVVQGLISLRHRFPQMILITHFEELKQKVETLVELVPTRHGWSEVRVNGALA